MISSGKAHKMDTKEPLHEHRAQEFELVRRVQAGDQDSFRHIVERHQDRIFSAVYRILRNREDAEDIAQQVFTKVFFAIKSFDCRCSLLTWIYKIAVNECYSHLRKRRLELAHEADAPDYEDFVSESWFGAARQPAADTEVAARDFLNKLLARLGEDDRLLLLLKEVEGHSVAELAEMTGSTESAIKTKLFRARQKLVDAAGRLSHRPLLPSVCPDRVSL
jgi:RNA polymerase sigma-70 factor (ECF subfamily)